MPWFSPVSGSKLSAQDSGASGGAKANVERNARCGNMRVHPLEDHLVVLIFIKAQIKEVPDGSTGLRNAIHNGFLNGAGERISGTRVISQKRCEITHRSKAQTENRRVLRGIDQLINMV